MTFSCLEGRVGNRPSVWLRWPFPFFFSLLNSSVKPSNYSNEPFNLVFLQLWFMFFRLLFIFLKIIYNNASTNGLTEVFNKTLCNILKKVVNPWRGTSMIELEKWFGLIILYFKLQLKLLYIPWYMRLKLLFH
jgi:hypothetical protein